LSFTGQSLRCGRESIRIDRGRGLGPRCGRYGGDCDSGRRNRRNLRDRGRWKGRIVSDWHERGIHRRCNGRINRRRWSHRNIEKGSWGGCDCGLRSSYDGETTHPRECSPLHDDVVSARNHVVLV
jgi:hypothetical protein